MSLNFDLPARFRDLSNNVWEELQNLVTTYKPLNLGPGFPDYAAAGYVPSILAEVTVSDDNTIHQYNRGFGLARLVRILAKFYSNLISHPINPMTELLVTCGALEALYSAMGGLIETGDEVIIIEPYLDCYESIVRVFGGIPRIVSLKYTGSNDPGVIETSASWILDPDELENLFNEKTKIIVLNTPHNPTGKVFQYAELEIIAHLCKKYNVVCLSDEVYEWLVYKPAKHIRMASLPGMWERTLTVGSFGITFCVTGWKCGWMYGPDYLIRNAMIAHQNNVYCHSTPIQEAIARCFEKELEKFDTSDSFLQNLSNELLPKRNTFMKTLIEAGFQPTLPEAGIFAFADWSNFGKCIDISSKQDEDVDFKFKWLLKNAKLCGIPASPFYSKEHKSLSEKYIRFCFFKKDETLKEAHDILMKWKTLDC